jgi:hypothetical protein
MFHGRQISFAELEQLADEVVKEAALRLLDPKDVPREKRGYRRRPRPKTAIIALAAQDVAEARIWAEDDDSAKIDADLPKIEAKTILETYA